MKILKRLFPSLIIVFLTTSSSFSQILYVSGDSLWVKESIDDSPIFITESKNKPIRGVVADTATNMVYWAQSSTPSTIYKASLDSLDKVSEITVSAGMFGGSVDNLSLDVAGGMLYWSDVANDGSIYRISAGFENGDAESLIVGEAEGVTDGILDIDLDLENSKIYWIKYGAVMRADLDGSNIEEVVDIPDYYMPVQPHGITLDGQHGYVYWINRDTDQIERALISGGEIETIIRSKTAAALDVDIKNERLYWVEDYIYTNEGGAIYSSDLDGTDKKLVLETSYTRGAFFVGNWQVPTSNEVYMRIDEPNKVKLCSNYPNPFNPETVIQYELPKAMVVNLKVYNSLGQVIESLVNEEVQSVGAHKVTFDSQNLATGIYFYQIMTEEGFQTRKMMLIK